MIRLIHRISKNLDRIPTGTFTVILLMPLLAMIVGATDVVLVWAVVLWGLLIYAIVKEPN